MIFPPPESSDQPAKTKKEFLRRTQAAQEEAKKILQNPYIPNKDKKALIEKMQRDLQEGKGPINPGTSSLA